MLLKALMKLMKFIEIRLQFIIAKILGFYVVTKYDDLKRVLTDYEFFSRDIAAYWEKNSNIKKGLLETWR